MISRRAFISLAGASALARPSFAFRSTQSGPAIDAARLRNRLERLSYHGRPPGGTFADGVNRVAYSVADLTARAWIIDEIKGMDVVPRLDAAGNIGGVTPNKPGVVFDPGVGRMLTGNTDIVLQMHYTTNGQATTDRTQVGLRFLKEPPMLQQRGGSVIQPRFVIPAGAPAHEVRGSRVLQDDTIITSFTPHMHVRGKDMIYTAKYPDGRTEVLLSVPRYDFNWQITYQLKEAKRMPKGTEIEVVAHFDNSLYKKISPDPTKDVGWGDQTFEEMMIGFWSTVVEPPAKVTTPQEKQ